jgi:hypothetical protein
VTAAFAAARPDGSLDGIACLRASRPSGLGWRLELLARQRMMRSFAARGDVDPLLAVMVGRGGWSQRARALAYATLPSGLIDRLARLD